MSSMKSAILLAGTYCLLASTATGQTLPSITVQDWWKEVAADLKARFPQADLVIENRALGGFSSQRLVKTAETDL